MKNHLNRLKRAALCTIHLALNSLINKFKAICAPKGIISGHSGQRQDEPIIIYEIEAEPAVVDRKMTTASMGIDCLKSGGDCLKFVTALTGNDIS